MIYEEIKNLFKKELEMIEDKMIAEIAVREPLQSSLIDFLKAPSKRIRSVLSMLYYKAVCQKEISDKQLEFLACTELIHNASLIHDDIIDESEKRRGKKSLYAEFNTKLGVLAGDYLLSVALEKLTDLGMAKIFSQTFKNMCIGEINQNFDRYKIGTLDDYIEKSKNKTGYLFETAIFGMMELADINFDKNKSKEFGLNLGIAFQINDDLKNLTGEDNLKPQKSDIAEGIYTAPVIFANNIDNYDKGVEKTIFLLNNYIEKSKLIIEEFSQNYYTKIIKDYLQQQCGKI